MTTLPEKASGAFVAMLLRVLRSQDPFGSLDMKTDAELLSGYLPQHPEAVGLSAALSRCFSWTVRLDCFFSAVARETERRSGCHTQAVVRVNPDGVGVATVLVGKVVGVLRFMRQAKCLGYATVEALDAAGEALVDTAVANARQYPEAAAAEVVDE